jgi:DNA-binding NarL/FixJ family response regulator
MLKDSQWQAAKQLIADLGTNPAEVDFLSLFGQLDGLTSLESCYVYRWQKGGGTHRVRHWVCVRDPQKAAFLRSAMEESSLSEVNNAMKRAGCYEPVESLILGATESQRFIHYHRDDYLAALCKLTRPPTASATCLVLVLRGRERISASTAKLFECVLPLAANYLELCTIQEGTVSGTWLTKREQQVLHRVTVGENTGRIAHSLGISERTVNYHLHNLYTKLGVRNRAEAVAIGMRMHDMR